MTTETHSIPRHVAIVMDGNGRWAKQKRLPRIAGHKQGLESARAIVTAARNSGVGVLSLFAFSSENWGRPEQEVGGLLDLFKLALSREIAALHDADIKVCFIGDRTRFSVKLQTMMDNAEEKTKHNSGMTLVLAMNYGGRWDVLQAVQQVLTQQKNNSSSPPFREQDFTQYLAMANYPEPDLFIRTSGEERISNFYLWQLAYTELYFTECLWPDFKEKEFQLALQDYALRQRRFGKTTEQVDTSC